MLVHILPRLESWENPAQCPSKTWPRVHARLITLSTAPSKLFEISEFGRDTMCSWTRDGTTAQGSNGCVTAPYHPPIPL